MGLIKKEVEVAQHADAVIGGLVKFAIACKQALADGFQVGQDAPVVVTAVVADLIPILGDLSGLAEEFKGDKAALLKAAVLGGSDLVAALTAKKA